LRGNKVATVWVSLRVSSKNFEIDSDEAIDMLSRPSAMDCLREVSMKRKKRNPVKPKIIRMNAVRRIDVLVRSVMGSLSGNLMDNTKIFRPDFKGPSLVTKHGNIWTQGRRLDGADLIEIVVYRPFLCYKKAKQGDLNDGFFCD
jgi:hypothetical protein